MPRFNLDEYETVADRITRLLEAHPDARIVTQDLTTEQDRTSSIWRIKAYVYLTAGDQAEDLPKATGHAFEIDGTGGANAYAAYENCETSAIGRAIAHALAGYSGDKKASASEMAKVNKGITPKPSRDWILEAKEIKEIVALRNLYQEAKKAKASQEILTEISFLAEELNEPAGTK